MTDNYFDIKRDNELIAGGSHFWCEGCLYARSLDSQSLDPRYCQGCYEVLSHEAGLLAASGNKHKPAWVPKTPKTSEKKSVPIVRVGSTIMSPINDQKSKVDIIQSVTPKVTHDKRGPKITELPDDLIQQWASEGLGSKAISTRLRAEGYFVSYKTIQRRLQGVLV